MKKYDFTFAHREEGFDEHIEHSIRGYSNLLEDTISLSRYFVEDDTNVYDLGCSTGKVTELMYNRNKDIANPTYVGIELAESFKQNLDERKKKLDESDSNNNIHFVYDDIRNAHIENSSLVTSIFTLQFMPVRDRMNVLQNIYNGLNVGGAFIFAEKVMCNNSRFQEMLTFNYYDYKKNNFEVEDIMEKEYTLRNMLKPNTEEELTCMLEEVGFDEIQNFWRNHLFTAYIAVKS